MPLEINDESGVYRSLSDGLFLVTNSGDVVPLVLDRDNSRDQLPDDSYRLVASTNRSYRAGPKD